MRHAKKNNHLGRKEGHRYSLLSNLAVSLITHKRIFTTVAKAKALRVFVEPIITRSKSDSTHSRRMVFADLQNKEAVTELFREVSVKVADRPGGYTRIIKTGNRPGDAAEMCMIELVDFNDLLLKEKGAKKTAAKSTRRRAGGKKATGTTKPADDSSSEEA
jgi:large subunit ribosomal protein L17